MNGKLRVILDELARPSAQKADWFGWAAAQLAHAMIGVVLAGALAFLLPGLWAFTIAALGYAAAKELPDFLRAPGWSAARDGVQDAAFVAAGAALAVAISGAMPLLFLVAFCAALTGLGLGVAARLKQQGGDHA
jgi:hypothetical protein